VPSQLRGGAAALFLSTHIEAVALQVAVQAGPAYPENLRGAQTVPLAELEHPPDVHLAHFVQRQRPPVVTFRPARTAVLQVFR